MAYSSTVLNQLQSFLPRYQFEVAVKRYETDRYVKRFNCWNQLTTMLYAQGSGKNSLREITQGLMVQQTKLYHLGLSSVKRSTLADANNRRDYRMFEDLFYHLLDRLKKFTPRHRFRFKNQLHTIDSTTIDLCLSMFNWAKFRTTKGAIKLHYDFDHSGQIPSFLVITDGRQHDVKVARNDLAFMPDSIYCFDRAYMDFKWLYSLTSKKSWFVTRAKENLRFKVIGQHPVNDKKGLLFDREIVLTGFYQSKAYPSSLRLVGYRDKETNNEYTFLTNNFHLSAYSITQIYKTRWQIEIFFKWIKQNLKIKSFLGTSKNAVLTQIWIAMIYFLLLAYIKYQTKYKASLFYLHKVIKEALMMRHHLIDLLNLTWEKLRKMPPGVNPQLSLFGL